MAKQGALLRNCPMPTCSSYLFAKMSKKPWKNKLQKDHTKAKERPKPSTSVDQLVSPRTPGPVVQITGRLTMKRYKYATVFVDQGTRQKRMSIFWFSFVVLLVKDCWSGTWFSQLFRNENCRIQPTLVERFVVVVGCIPVKENMLFSLDPVILLTRVIPLRKTFSSRIN